MMLDSHRSLANDMEIYSDAAGSHGFEAYYPVAGYAATGNPPKP